MRKYKSNKTLMVLMILLTACELQRELEVELPETDPRLVVNAVFAADSAWNINVYESQPINSRLGDDKKIMNAEISIRHADEVISFLYDDSFYGTYRSSKGQAQTGLKYELSVSVPGFENVTATATVPNPVSLHDVKLEKVAAADEPDLVELIFRLRFDDPANDKNFYAVSIIKYEQFGDVISEGATSLVAANEALQRNFFESEYQNYKGSQEFPLFFDDVLFDGQTYTLEVKATERIMGSANGTPRYYVYLKTISEDYYTYVKTVHLQKDQMKNPFAQPVQVSNNIVNGFGIFTGFSQSLYILE